MNQHIANEPETGAVCEICGREVEEPTHQGPWPPRPTRILNIAERYHLDQRMRRDNLKAAIARGDVDPGCCCSDCHTRYLD